ncbi:MAG: FMN-binding protein [Acholeplasmataceae bacterium]|nr:FMN-binding protein [Acholeplasmataceae bacterium]MCK9427787.1 FMN-binding protein [Acholeplasmataceae bacterium]MDD4090141.1 FMN-binding protein [Acholeplasmataceae bacterium]HHT39619.1 FMN-binding protein [Acholeplasmataceae bacterium]
MKIFKTAIVLTLVGLLCGALIGTANYITAPIIEKNKEKEAMKAYEGFFPDLEGINEEEISAGKVYVKVEILKSDEIIGYVFKAKGTNPRGLVDLAIAVDLEGNIKGVKILDTENTPGFWDQYVPKLNEIDGLIGDLKGVDNISGVTQTGALLNDLIKDIVKEAIQYTIIIDEDLLYKEVFDGFDSREEDETFEATDLVIKKEIIKDEDEEVIGYAYTLQGTTKEFLDKDYKKEYGELTLLVGLDLDNKVVGIRTVETTHTGTYYDKYQEEYDELVGVELVDDANVDLVGGSTVSGDSIQELIDALKEVIANE